jgi:glycosyltransferase involved in cell wall biosynthesis
MNRVRSLTVYLRCKERSSKDMHFSASLDPDDRVSAFGVAATDFLRIREFAKKHGFELGRESAARGCIVLTGRALDLFGAFREWLTCEECRSVAPSKENQLGLLNENLRGLIVAVDCQHTKTSSSSANNTERTASAVSIATSLLLAHQNRESLSTLAPKCLVSSTPTREVTICVPYFRGRRFIRRAVESLLSQTHRQIVIIVVNDGDPDDPWGLLASMDDPRLVRFDLKRNHNGPYFANAVVANATRSPWFLVQEQDDWSEPDRVACLLAAGERSGADFVVSAQNIYQENADGSNAVRGVRFGHIGLGTCPACGPVPCSKCFVDTKVTPEYKYRAPHTGLFCVSLLRLIGGYYGGLYVSYDSLLMNILLMLGRIAYTPSPLYNRLLHPASLTRAKATGFGSPVWQMERQVNVELYRRAFRYYKRYLRGEMTSDELSGELRHICQTRVAYTEKLELEDESARLDKVLSNRATDTLEENKGG